MFWCNDYQYQLGLGPFITWINGQLVTGMVPCTVWVAGHCVTNPCGRYRKMNEGATNPCL